MVKKTSSYHHGNLKESILAVALQILTEENEKALTFRRLAKELNVSAMAPYKHFKNKEQILLKLIENGFTRLKANLLAASTSENLTQKLTQQGISYVEFAIAHAYQYQLMFSSHEGIVWSDEVQALSIETLGVMQETVSALLSERDCQNQQTAEVALMCWTLVHGITEMALSKNFPDQFDYTQFTHNTISVFVNGLS